MDIKEIILKLNLDEKFLLLTGKDNWNTVAIERLGIPSITVSDGPHGVRKEYTAEDGTIQTHEAVCFPTNSAMAATWNRPLINEVGKALGRESAHLGVDVLLGPGTNIKRTPLCGRNFEYFSEDPYLAGELAAEYIKGVQSQGVGTSLKHFSGNNQEFDRRYINSEIDTRTLHEIYLKPFEIAVKKAQPWTVMCAYNRLNGIYCSENQLLLRDILKGEFGHDGIVVSDWWAVHDRAKSLKASLELEMPYNDKSLEILKGAYEKGEITDEEIDAALERLLDFVFKAYESRSTRTKEYDINKQYSLAKKVALEAITLLKNEDGILPIDKTKIKQIAVIGHMAEYPAIQGGGAACINPDSTDSPLEKIIELAGDEVKVQYVPAYYNWKPYPEVTGLNLAMDAASDADLAVVFVGNTDKTETEMLDRESIKLTAAMENVIIRIAEQNPNTVVVVQAGAAIDMSPWINKVKAVVFAWFTGKASGSATADILFGLANPCGKTAETFPLKLEDNPSYGTYPGDGYTSWYSEGLMVGYRYYDTYNKEVLFPFGYGLSYTTFEYSDLKVSPETANENEEVTVTVKVKNTGGLAGKETVQLYVRDVASTAIRPYKELKGFEKISLEPGEEKVVKFILDRSAFSYYNTTLNKWIVEGGKFEVLVENLRGRFTIFNTP